MAIFVKGDMTVANIQLAKNLLRLRKDHNYTQKQLGKKLNITHQAYSYYEHGKRDPNIHMLTKLSEIYEIPLEQLLTQPCNINGAIREEKGPYRPGIIMTSGDTLFLTEEETELLLRFRDANEEERKLTQKILGLPEDSNTLPEQ